MIITHSFYPNVWHMIVNLTAKKLYKKKKHTHIIITCCRAAILLLLLIFILFSSIQLIRFNVYKSLSPKIGTNMKPNTTKKNLRPTSQKRNNTKQKKKTVAPSEIVVVKFKWKFHNKSKNRTFFTLVWIIYLINPLF